MEKYDQSKYPNDQSGLAEFETGTATGLAPFEDECSILLDEFPDLIETIDFDESHPDDPETAEPLEPEPELPDEEPYQDESEEIVTDETSETTDADQQDTVEEIFEEVPPVDEEPVAVEPEPVYLPRNPVIGFFCEHALDALRFTDESGQLKDRPFVHLVSLPCAGMVKPGWIRMALEEGASGVFTISCTLGSCHHRRGAEIAKKRHEGLEIQVPGLEIDTDRVEFFTNHPAAKNEILEIIDRFLIKLGNLDVGLAVHPKSEL